MTPPIAVQPWAEWVDALSADLRGETAYAVRELLDRLFELGPTGNRERAALGGAGRRLLAFALDAERNDPRLVADAAKELRNGCAALFASVAVWDTATLATERMAQLISDPATHADQVRHVLHQLRGMLVMGDPGAPDARHDAARRRALDIVAGIARRAAALPDDAGSVRGTRWPGPSGRVGAGARSGAPPDVHRSLSTTDSLSEHDPGADDC